MTKTRELISAYLHAFLGVYPWHVPPVLTRRGAKISVSWTDRAYLEVTVEELVTATERLRELRKEDTR